LQHVRAFVETAVLTSLDIVLIVGGYILLILTLSPWVALLAVCLCDLTWYNLRFQPSRATRRQVGDGKRKTATSRSSRKTSPECTW